MKINKRIVFFLFGFSLLTGGLTPTVHAETSPLVITWQATRSYVPAAYVGKALPPSGAQITASVQLFSRGNFADLKNQTIYWYLDGSLIGGGTGKERITFTLPSSVIAPNLLELRVALPNYGGNFLLSAVDIPVVQPKAVVYAPYTNGFFSKNTVTVKALPFFFNAPFSSLVFNWSANGQSAGNAENPADAQIVLAQGTPSNTTLSVALTVSNPLDSTVAMASKNLTYQTSP